MSTFFDEPRYLPCPRCGVSVARPERDAHVCAEEDRARHGAFLARDELDRFEDEFRAYLESPEGLFAEWDAERRRP
jgi:hypothetical protein